MADATTILIFGGTFDPPHRAHVVLPRLAACELGCGLVLYVPASKSPLKGEAPTPPEHRLEMLRLALRHAPPDPPIEISTIEIDGAVTGAPSYTIDTLEALRRRYPEARLRLLIGADQALDFHRWKDWRRIIAIAEPAVMLRPPWDEARFRDRLRGTFDAREVDKWLERVVHLPQIDVNATDLRERIRSGQDVGDAVDPAVVEYARSRGLYGGTERLQASR
jgi:nicotinate-nucleotide adenylyltransferase